MKITINGHAKEVDAANIGALVGQFCPQAKHIITEVNGTIVPNTAWDSTALKDGDAVELVSFVGGG